MMIAFKYMNLITKTQDFGLVNSSKEDHTKSAMEMLCDLNISLLVKISKSMDMYSILQTAMISPRNGMLKTLFGREYDRSMTIF